MAAPIPTQKYSSHARSISLPSRSHPLTLNVEEQLYRLRATKTTSTLSSSSSTCKTLCGLKDLYECVDDMLHTQLAQQSLSNEKHDKCMEDVLDRFLRLLDVCGTTRDILSQTKGSVKDLESSLRRTRCGESRQVNEISKYVISRRNMKKIASKCAGNLKKMEKQHGAVHLDGDCSLGAMVSILRDVEEISFPVLESLLAFVSKPKTRLNSSNWSLVSKFMQSKRVVVCEGEEHNGNELEKIDAAFDALKCHINVKQVQNVLKPLEALELSIQEIEEELDSVIRCLVNIRVSLLNVFNH